MRISLIACLLCLGLAACEPEKPAAPDPVPAVEAPRIAAPAPDMDAAAAANDQVAQGRAIAGRECSSCHALDQDAVSPRRDAPPMRDMLARYDADILADDLIAGIKMGHEDMPLFDFNVIAADALVAYLRSIRPPPGDGG